MIKSGQAYHAAITGDARRVLLRAVIDIISPDIVFGAGEASGQIPWSKPEQLHNKVFGNPAKYATLERDRWALDGTWDLLPDDPTQAVGQMGYIGNVLSSTDGTFSTPPWVELQFSGVSVLQACSVYFPGNDYDGLPEDFTVEVKQGGTAYHTRTYTGNTASSVSLEGFTVNNPDAIRVTVTKWSRPGRRMRVVEIVPGVYEGWDGGMIAEFSVKQQGNIAATALPYGTCILKIDNLSRRFEPRKKNGLFQSIEERQGIDVSLGVRLADGTDEYKRLGIFYQYSGGWKTGDNGLTMQWNLVDIIGLLANREFLAPATFPTTLGGWIGALAAQLGVNFKDRWHVDPNYTALPVTVRTAENVQGKKCGDILRWVCQATGTWPRADASTGDLTAEPLWSEGNKVTLDNLNGYPVMKANGDVAAAGSALALRAATGCDGVAVGRGAMGNPWLFGQIAAAMECREVPPPPSLHERFRVLRRHIYDMCEDKGEYIAMQQARTHAAWYMHGLRGAATLRRECCGMLHFTDLDRVIEHAWELQRETR